MFLSLCEALSDPTNRSEFVPKTRENISTRALRIDSHQRCNYSSPRSRKATSLIAHNSRSIFVPMCLSTPLRSLLQKKKKTSFVLVKGFLVNMTEQRECLAMQRWRMSVINFSNNQILKFHERWFRFARKFTLREFRVSSSSTSFLNVHEARNPGRTRVPVEVSLRQTGSGEKPDPEARVHISFENV